MSQAVDVKINAGFTLSSASEAGGFNRWLEDVRGRAPGREKECVTLYGHPDTRSSRCLWMAREVEAINAEFSIQLVPIMSHEQYTVATDKLNPNRRQPFLEDNGTAMFESMAVNLHLAKKYAPGVLGPENIGEEASMLKWSFWATSELDMKLWELVINGPARVDEQHPWYTHPVVRNPHFPDMYGQTGEQRFEHMFGYPRSRERELALTRDFRRAMRALNMSLIGRRFLAADRFTVADLNVSAILAWSRHLGTQALAPFPRVQEWMTRCCYERTLSPHYHVPHYDGLWVISDLDWTGPSKL